MSDNDINSNNENSQNTSKSTIKYKLVNDIPIFGNCYFPVVNGIERPELLYDMVINDKNVDSFYIDSLKKHEVELKKSNFSMNYNNSQRVKLLEKIIASRASGKSSHVYNFIYPSEDF